MVRVVSVRVASGGTREDFTRTLAQIPVRAIVNGPRGPMQEKMIVAPPSNAVLRACVMNVTEYETFRRESTFTTSRAPGLTFHRSSVCPADSAAIVARLLIVHGYGDHSGRYAQAMNWLAGRGIACHAFDLRGHGRSSGKRAYVRQWAEYLDDLRACLEQPDIEYPRHATSLFVLGHSHGGLVVAVAGIRQTLAAPRIAGVILSAPYLVNAFRVPMHKSIVAQISNFCWPSLRVRSGIRPSMGSSDPAMVEESIRDPLMLRCATPRWYVGQRRAQREAMREMNRFTLPLLMLQGDADTIADPRGGKEFHDRAGSPDKTMIVYPGFKHEPLREAARERVYRDIHRWILQRSSAAARPERD